jgi:hypothetical protein
MKRLLAVFTILLLTIPVMASDYYVGKKSGDDRSVTVYVYLPIPNTQTVAGTSMSDQSVTYRESLVASLESTGSAIPNLITDTDLAVSDFAMDAGQETITSATGGFTPQMVGSRLNIASGTNFVAGNYKVVGYNSANSLELNADATNGSNASSGVGTVISRQTMLDNGELYEYRMSFRFSSKSLSDANRRSEIENGNDNEDGVAQMLLDIADDTSDLWLEVLGSLTWHGYHRIVP